MRRNDRGATLVEYALIVALLCVALIGSIQWMQTRSEDRYDERSSQGNPTEEFGNLGPGGGADGGTTDAPTEPPGGAVANISIQPLTAVAPKSGNSWSMTVTVTAIGDGQPLAGVVFSGSAWDPASVGQTTTCTTSSSGICTFTTLSGLSITDTTEVTFTLGTPSFTNPPDSSPPVISVSGSTIHCDAPQNGSGNGSQWCTT